MGKKNKLSYTSIHTLDIFKLGFLLFLFLLSVLSENYARMTITKRYSLFKTMSAYCIINILADINEQVLIKKRTMENYRYGKTARITLVGTFLIGPIAFTWMRLAEVILPGKGIRTVIKKVLIDQSCVGPFSISTFYICKYMDVE